MDRERRILRKGEVRMSRDGLLSVRARLGRGLELLDGACSFALRQPFPALQRRP